MQSGNNAQFNSAELVLHASRNHARCSALLGKLLSSRHATVGCHDSVTFNEADTASQVGSTHTSSLPTLPCRCMDVCQFNDDNDKHNDLRLPSRPTRGHSVQPTYSAE